MVASRKSPLDLARSAAGDAAKGAASVLLRPAGAAVKAKARSLRLESIDPPPECSAA